MKRKAIFLIYRLLQSVALPAILAYLLVRCLRNRAYFGTLRERFGELPALWQKTAAGAIWVHAVSVGEVLAALPLLNELKRRVPSTPVFVSVSTLAGYETAGKRLSQADGIFYAPFDFVWVVRRVLRRLRPSVVVVIETEIWPNLFREARRIGCGLLIANGRISDRTAGRYKSLAPVFGPVLALCDGILAQSPAMRQRFLDAGAPPSIASDGGNLKYDFVPASMPDDSPVAAFLAAGQGRPLWIAASSSADGLLEEEDAVLSAQRDLPGWRLILAPRKPERFSVVAQKLDAARFRWTRRSSLEDPDADVLLLDSIGELASLFIHADVVFMGGTLAAVGGHNVLEPAAAGKPVIAGPHLENFREIAQHLENRQALLRIASGAELANVVLVAAADPAAGERAAQAALEKQGATERAADAVLALYDSCYPGFRTPQPGWAGRWIFAQLWGAASARDRRRKQAASQKLPVPVVCVGNITAGGTGKTPVAIALLNALADHHPALLTRGHGRHSRDIVILPTGNERVPASLTGDEVQLILSEAHVPIGIGGSRYKAATRLLQHGVSPGFFLLDDGFQHLHLQRDFDLVLIDALNPFGSGYLLPLGRLREPLSGLARASAFLITRSDEAPNIRAIESVLRKHNAQAPVFHARTVARRWVNREGATLDVTAMNDRRSVAFCGLGNPESFWRTLKAIGAAPLEHHTFPDHHRYTPAEIRRLTQRARDLGADCLLTTAKDAINLPEEDFGMAIHWLEIGVVIDDAETLLEKIKGVL